MFEKFTPDESEKVKKESESKEFTEEELFRIALKHIESVENRGSSSNKARTKKLTGDKGSYIEENIKKAHEMVASGEAERIAKQEYKGGVEKPKHLEPEDED